MNKQELENRLIDFAATIIIVASKFEKNYAGNHLAGQIIRSGTSPALNYGEAQSAESSKDFIHKMNIALKEANETEYWLMLLKDSEYINEESFTSIHKDCDELIRLLASIVKTTKSSDDGKK